MYIKNSIKNYIKRAKLRFHTPGHKGRLLKEDITEIDSEFPGDCIKKAQDDAAQIFGATEVRFLTQGSSIGNKAAIMALVKNKCNSDKPLHNLAVLCESTCHRSVLDGIYLSGAQAVVVKNNVREGINLPLTADQVEKALSNNPNIIGAVITSPDYYGLNAKIDAARLISDKGRFLHVDSAHGAHYPFRQDLFDNSIYSYAQSAVFSVHKTLPALTQSSLLAIYNGTKAKEMDHFLEVLGTTSPLYPMLSSIEHSIEYTYKNKEAFARIKKSCSEFKSAIKCLDNDDFTRIVIDSANFKLSGNDLYFLLKGLGIVAEKFDDRYVILIVSIADKPRHIRKVLKAITNLRNKKT